MATSVLDLISTPVAVLDGLALRTRVGLSADDPLSARHRDERFRLFLSIYTPKGSLAGRRELDPLNPGERRMIDLSVCSIPEFGGRSFLCVVHRVPFSQCPPGQDPEGVVAHDADHSTYNMYRTMVEYGWLGQGFGGVIYETPPSINDLRARGRVSPTLIFSSKLAVGMANDTVLTLINYSTNPAHDRAIPLRFELHDEDGGTVCGETRSVPAFSVETISMREIVGASAQPPTAPGLRFMSLVGSSLDGTLIPLFVQMNRNSGSVAVEHSHPPQAYLLTADPARRYALKDAAARRWSERLSRPA